MRACSVSEQASHIPLDGLTFLRWLSRWWRGQHESASPSFSISRAGETKGSRSRARFSAHFSVKMRYPARPAGKKRGRRGAAAPAACRRVGWARLVFNQSRTLRRHAAT